MSTYYTRYDVGKRYAFFYTIGVSNLLNYWHSTHLNMLQVFASGLGGILAYGIMQMAGIGGYLGWSVSILHLKSFDNLQHHIY